MREIWREGKMWIGVEGEYLYIDGETAMPLRRLQITKVPNPIARAMRKDGDNPAEFCALTYLSITVVRPVAVRPIVERAILENTLNRVEMERLREEGVTL